MSNRPFHFYYKIETMMKDQRRLFNKDHVKKATEMIYGLYDLLKEQGYTSHANEFSFNDCDQFARIVKVAGDRKAFIVQDQNRTYLTIIHNEVKSTSYRLYDKWEERDGITHKDGFRNFLAHRSYYDDMSDNEPGCKYIHYPDLTYFQDKDIIVDKKYHFFQPVFMGVFDKTRVNESCNIIHLNSDINPMAEYDLGEIKNFLFDIETTTIELVDPDWRDRR